MQSVENELVAIAMRDNEREDVARDVAFILSEIGVENKTSKVICFSSPTRLKLIPTLAFEKVSTPFYI